MEDRGQIAFRYCDEDGAVTPQANPNGSLRNIAGIYNEAKTVLGLMPHPERLADPRLGGTDGRAPFDSPGEALDRTTVVAGKGVSVRVDRGGRRILKKTKHTT